MQEREEEDGGFKKLVFSHLGHVEPETSKYIRRLCLSVGNERLRSKQAGRIAANVPSAKIIERDISVSIVRSTARFVANSRA